MNGGTPIAPWTLHDLRRSVASGMAKLGVALPMIEKILNHVQPSFGGVQGIYQRHDFRGRKAGGAGSLGTASADADLVERGPVAVAKPLRSRVMA